MLKFLRTLLTKIGIAIAVVGAVVVGYLLHDMVVQSSGGKRADSAAVEEAKEQGSDEETVWTCSMHPQIRQSEPGDCPICGMELIRASQAGDGEGSEEPRLQMSPVAKKLAEIQTSRVRRGFPTHQVRMSGKVAYDEQQVKTITAWVPGRLDRMFVDFTGSRVEKGQHLVSLYSPKLISAQEELIQAQRTLEQMRDSSGDLLQSARSTTEAAREKLRLWGLKKSQIKKIEKNKEPLTHLTVYAPMGGTVVKKHVNEGEYVDTGSKLYTIADLSRVWIKLDAYESNLTWLRYGQWVSFTVESYPGEVFHGRIAFIDPVMSDKTRTISVRVNAANPDGKLKPGMLVNAVVNAKVSARGPVMDPALEDKWICPMHPGEIEESSGACDECGMDLVPTGSLG